MNEQILFYSKKCKNCNQLMTMLQHSPRLTNSFLIICIDDKRYRIPKAIKYVPSAIIPSPSGEPQIYTGKSLFNWVKSHINIQQKQAQSQPVQRHGHAQGQGQGQVQVQGQGQGNMSNSNSNNVEPEIWDAYVMNNLSGTFAFIDDNENEKVVEKGGFATLNNAHSFRIITPDDDGIKNKGDIKPVSYDASSYNNSSSNGSSSSNPFAENYQNNSYNQSQNQSHSHSQTNYNPNQYNPNQYNKNQSYDPNMFKDSNYEGNDQRSNSKKAALDSQLEAFKNSRDMGMPQPLRRM
jgi:hypothetical protein